MIANLPAADREFLCSPRHGLVTGDPGSGKTTLALLKAQWRIESGLEPGQVILFLSFSRAAVARALDACRETLTSEVSAAIQIATFHAFFWEVLRTHGYLLGGPRRLDVWAPHDEAAAKPDFSDSDEGWRNEVERRFTEDGMVAFDLFAPKVQRLLAGSVRLKKLVAGTYPLIIVDEAQDTGDAQWACMRELASESQLLCLADLSQQIYDWRPDVRADRIQQVLDELVPTTLSLEGRNHRSPGREITVFARDLLQGTPRDKGYGNISLAKYHPKARHRDKMLRAAVGRLAKAVEKDKGAPCESMAILASWGRGVGIITRALSEAPGRRRIPHRVLIDEAPAVLSGRCLAFLLQPQGQDGRDGQLARVLDLVAAVLKARGGAGNLAQAKRLSEQSRRVRDGGRLRATELGTKLRVLLESLSDHQWLGDPRRDWMYVRETLQGFGPESLESIAKHAEHLELLGHGHRVAAALGEMWAERGQYDGAEDVYNAAVSQDQIIADTRDNRGISVMTIHKAKGKEFDGVVLFDDMHNCPFMIDPDPYPRSRRLLRVGITRARYHAMLLCSVAGAPRILAGFNL